MRAAAVTVVAASMLASCIEPSLIDCGDLSCAAGQVCVPAAAGCFPPDRVAACAGLADGATCQTTDLPFGICALGVCMPAGCGDGVVQGTEQCDGPVESTSCLDLGFYRAAGLACTSDCRFDASACGGGYCGDSIINGPEICDGARPSNVSCFSIGYDYGATECSSICGIDAGACGRIGFRLEAIPSVTGGTFVVDLAEVGGVVFAIDTHGNIFRRTGTTWTADTVPTLPAGAALASIWGPALDNIYAVGAAGLVLHYDGTAWTEQAAFTSATLREIRGTSATDMLVIGQGGVAFHYDGTSWQATPTNVTVNLTHLAVISATNAYTVGPSGTVLQWNGSSWLPVSTGVASTVTLETVAATDASNVYIAGTGGTLQHYDGMAWTSISLPWSSTISALAPTEQGILLFGLPPILGQSFLVAYVTDGHAVRLGPIGALFAAVTTSSGERLVSTGLSSPFAVASNTGPSWALSGTDTPFDAADVAVRSGNELYAVGTYNQGTGGFGQVLRYDGNSWSQILELDTELATSIVATGTELFVGTSTGDVSHWTGTAWETLTTPFFDVTGISSAPGTKVYASATAGVMSYDGVMWTDEQAGASFLTDVQVFADGTVVAVGEAQAVHFDGVSWTAKDIPVGQATLRSVWGSASNDVYAVGDSGSIAHYDGSSWTKLDLGVQENVTGVSGTAADDVWVSTAFGQILHFDGVGWSPVRPRFDPTSTPTFTRLDATPGIVLFGAKAGRIDPLIRE